MARGESPSWTPLSMPASFVSLSPGYKAGVDPGPHPRPIIAITTRSASREHLLTAITITEPHNPQHPHLALPQWPP
jgi:hypothetical protein